MPYSITKKDILGVSKSDPFCVRLNKDSIKKNKFTTYEECKNLVNNSGGYFAMPVSNIYLKDNYSCKDTNNCYACVPVDEMTFKPTNVGDSTNANVSDTPNANVVEVELNKDQIKLDNYLICNDPSFSITPDVEDGRYWVTEGIYIPAKDNSKKNVYISGDYFGDSTEAKMMKRCVTGLLPAGSETRGC